MKMKTPLLAVLFGIPLSVGNAFTLDAVGYSGGILEPNPFSVFVPCYGEVVFDTGPDSALVVDSAFEEKDGFGGEALGFDKSDAIRIILDDESSAALAENRDTTRAGASFRIGSSHLQQAAFAGSQAKLGTGTAIPSKDWHAVPEPASLALGFMGCALLFLRRRR
jgi:hypothetical protein